MQELAEKYEIADMVSLKASGEESEEAAEKKQEKLILKKRQNKSCRKQ